MKITLFAVGKTQDSYISDGFTKFEKRIKRYISFDFVIIPDIKNAKNFPQPILKEKEGELILQHTSDYDCIVLMDENGKEFGSIEFSGYLQNKMLHSTKKLAFIIGGAYGFSKQVYQKANEKISLSKMTFSHQIIRLLFAEQLYRAFTIIKGEPYHHQ